MSAIRPYQIDVSSDALDLLHRKLELASLPDSEGDGAGWDNGAPLADIKRMTSYWKDGFDWKAQEAKLNEMPQFKTTIEIDSKSGGYEVDMHFVHQKSNVVGAIPLLFVHGWPGSFIEVQKLLPLLTSNAKGPSFHVVAPSLLNFGFSSRVTKKDFGLTQHAESLHKVMLALGYDEYVTQGGDWGYMITRILGILYPKHVMAIHTNMPFAGIPSFRSSPLLAATSTFKYLLRSYFWTTAELNRHAKSLDFYSKGNAYMKLNSTKPQTASYMLDDSPVATLAYIYEKLHDWADEYPWTDDEVLTWISIYWFSTPGPGASTFIYKFFKGKNEDITIGQLGSYIDKPLGFHYFPGELVGPPKHWLGGMGKVVWIGDSEKGGHFAAWESPHDLADGIKQMFGKDGGAFGAVKGKSGYDD